MQFEKGLYCKTAMETVFFHIYWLSGMLEKNHMIIL